LNLAVEKLNPFGSASAFSKQVQKAEPNTPQVGLDQS
jgi:hypothetical protein